MTKVLIATSNLGKIKEFKALFLGTGLQVVTPVDLGLAVEVLEDGKDYHQNAGKKAKAYCLASGLIAIADDSGLEVDVLDGAPGLYSARYSPKPGATDSDRRQYLLRQCADKPKPWKAFFHATVAIAFPDGRMVFTEGKCYGEIKETEKGSGGFGYDPIFHIPDLNQTMAEVSMDVKNEISHRAIAVKLAIPVLLGE
jgi:XTP/dITP diphosphohydrolase